LVIVVAFIKLMEHVGVADVNPYNNMASSRFVKNFFIIV
jgi:hypothetical protein